MSPKKPESYVYGPVPSRRLGRSLGVDLVPFKTCSYDCIYCQLGRTTAHTCERKEWFPVEDILEDVAAALDSSPDYITLSGSGEPTLHSGLSGIISGIKALTDIPVAIITNGSLLWRPDVRRSLQGVDLVVPSLDAADETLWRRVNRPERSLDFERMVEGLVEARRELCAEYWLEVLLCAGITDTPEHVERLKGGIDRIAPGKVHLNTVVRPGAESSARPIAAERMHEIAAELSGLVDVVADFQAPPSEKGRVQARQILALLERRPCTLQDVAAGLAVHPNEALKVLDALLSEGRITKEPRGSKTFYLPGREDAAC